MTHSLWTNTYKGTVYVRLGWPGNVIVLYDVDSICLALCHLHLYVCLSNISCKHVKQTTLFTMGDTFVVLTVIVLTRVGVSVFVWLWWWGGVQTNISDHVCYCSNFFWGNNLYIFVTRPFTMIINTWRDSTLAFITDNNDNTKLLNHGMSRFIRACLSFITSDITMRHDGGLHLDVSPYDNH